MLLWTQGRTFRASRGARWLTQIASFIPLRLDESTRTRSENLEVRVVSPVVFTRGDLEIADLFLRSIRR